MISPALLAALQDTDYRRQIDEALARLDALEGGDATAMWAAALAVPLYENPPEWTNPFTGELVIEPWERRAARLLSYRMWRLEEEHDATRIQAVPVYDDVLSRPAVPAGAGAPPQGALHPAGA